MVLAFGLLLTVAVVVYVGYPLFSRQPATATANGDALEAAIAARRGRQPKSPVASTRGPVCPRCKALNEPGDKYCAQCGAFLARRA